MAWHAINTRSEPYGYSAVSRTASLSGLFDTLSITPRNTKAAVGVIHAGNARNFAHVSFLQHVYPDSTIVRKTACHGAILGFVIGA